MAASKKPEIIQCSGCGRRKKEDEYYNTNSSFYKKNIITQYPKLPFCKTCVQKKYDELFEYIGVNQKVIYLLCAMLDMPFKKSAFDMTEKSNPVSFIGVYIRNVNSRKEFANMTFTDSDDVINTLTDNSEMASFRIKWGSGFTYDEYVAMEERYNELVREKGEPDFVKADSYRKFILSSVVYDRDIGSLDSKDRNSAASNYFRALRESGLGGKDVKEITKDMTCGEIIQAFEQHSPILKRKETDIDEMNDVKKEIVNHLKRLFGGKSCH